VVKELSHLPIIVDPSHPAGRRELVIPLAKAAYAVGADGIMVEVHPGPDKALSDSAQQLTFNDFERLLKELRELGWKGATREAAEGVPRYVLSERVEENDWYTEVFLMELGGLGWRA
jgi:3-deoxy-7-phosphoheptulonate synthase